MKTLFFIAYGLFISFVALFASCDKSNDPIAKIDEETETNLDSVVSPEDSNGQLTITFNFKHGGIASSQYAIWVEDREGNLIRTIYVTSFTAKGGYSYRADALPTWVAKANLGEMSDSEIDGITGATPQNGKQTYVWDGTDDKGQKVSNGKYNFYIEGTLYWSSRVLFSGSVEWGSKSQQNIPIQVKYINESDTNKDMITALKAEYVAM